MVHNSGSLQFQQPGALFWLPQELRSCGAHIDKRALAHTHKQEETAKFLKRSENLEDHAITYWIYKYQLYIKTRNLETEPRFTTLKVH